MKALRGLLVVALLVFPVLGGCSRSPGSREGSDSVGPQNSAAVSGPAWPVLAILKTGAEPLWFEFSDPALLKTGGLPEASNIRLIPSPGEASLVDFAPWPHARYSAGMLASGSGLVLAINREGFLILEPGAESEAATLYRVADPAWWDPYTVASVFTYEDKPAALLYRDDFFSLSPAPPPEHPAAALSKELPGPEALGIPALEALIKEEGWELDALTRGPDGAWYYRSRTARTPDGQSETAHYRAPDLSRAGEKISLEDFRNASRPESLSNAPLPVGHLLTVFPQLIPGLSGVPALKVVSPEYPEPRFFSPSPGAEEGFSFFWGFYRKASSAEGEATSLAFAVLPNGQGLAVKDEVFFQFTLPPLPQGFVYTGAGLAGNVFAASWEEQEESAVGAAGFMALSGEALGF